VRVAPHRLVWADVVIPRHDRLWVDDVGRSSRWLGEVWAAALVDLGVADARPYEGRIVKSLDVCFAGIAPGEVVAGQTGVTGRKVVGISQRRTRAAALFQCAALRKSDPDEVAAVGLDELLGRPVDEAEIEVLLQRRLRFV
jgi:lipoate-protein ligase A